MKRRERRTLRFNDDKTTAGVLLKTDQKFQDKLIEPHIWHAVEETGFEFDASSEPYRVPFDESEL
jgi:hypothetical protein